jgi:hypothetical protein
MSAKDWHEKPPPDVRSLKDAIRAAEQLRGDLRFIVQVHASDWDKVILVDEIYRLRRSGGRETIP